MKKTKRLFFGVDANASWPFSLPEGRQVEATQRHMTLAFLGETNWELLEPLLSSMPQFPHKVGVVGEFDRCLFLPDKEPHVVAWQVKGDEITLIESYQKELEKWLKSQEFLVKESSHPFLPHVTLCRAPFDRKAWREKWTPLPVLFHRFHLYESVGPLQYQPLWTQECAAPFIEISHTADIAFIIQGESVEQIYRHAHTALAFHCPEILPYCAAQLPESLDDIIIALNDSVGRVDAEEGAPFKAVSFHGELVENCNGTLSWEMIVDV